MKMASETSYGLILLGSFTKDERPSLKDLAFAKARLEEAKSRVDGQDEEAKTATQAWLGECLGGEREGANSLLFLLSTSAKMGNEIVAIVTAVSGNKVVEFASVMIENLPLVKEKKLIELSFHSPKVMGEGPTAAELKTDRMKGYTLGLLKVLQSGIYSLMVLMGDAVDLVVICQQCVTKLAADHCSFRPLTFYAQEGAAELGVARDYKTLVGTPCYGWDRRWPLTRYLADGRKVTKEAWHWLSGQGSWMGKILHGWYTSHSSRWDKIPWKKLLSLKTTFSIANLPDVKGIVGGATLPHIVPQVGSVFGTLIVSTLTVGALYYFVSYGICLLGDFGAWLLDKLMVLLANAKAKTAGVAKSLKETTGRTSRWVREGARSLSRSISPFCPRRGEKMGLVGQLDAGRKAQKDRGVGATAPRLLKETPKHARADGEKETEEETEKGTTKKHRRLNSKHGNDDQASWSTSLCSLPMKISISKARFPSLPRQTKAVKKLLPSPSTTVKELKAKPAQISLTLRVPPSKNGSKVLFWAATKPHDGRVISQREAYGDYSNCGIAQVEKGSVVFRLDQPRVYSKGKRVYSPHVHFVFSTKDHTRWSSKIYTAYVPRRACGVKGLSPYDKARESTYTPTTALLLKGSPAVQEKLANRLAKRGLYNVFFSVN